MDVGPRLEKNLGDAPVAVLNRQKERCVSELVLTIEQDSGTNAITHIIEPATRSCFKQDVRRKGYSNTSKEIVSEQAKARCSTFQEKRQKSRLTSGSSPGIVMMIREVVSTGRSIWSVE